MIPKPGKPGKLRPLGIPSINDRIVQEVIRTIIEPIYEMNFSNLSHGFRPNRGCHTALKWGAEPQHQYERLDMIYRRTRSGYKKLFPFDRPSNTYDNSFPRVAVGRKKNQG